MLHVHVRKKISVCLYCKNVNVNVGDDGVFGEQKKSAEYKGLFFT